MNGQRAGKCILRMEHIRGHLCHRYSITVNQVMVSSNKKRKDLSPQPGQTKKDEF